MLNSYVLGSFGLVEGFREDAACAEGILSESFQEQEENPQILLGRSGALNLVTRLTTIDSITFKR